MRVLNSKVRKVWRIRRQHSLGTCVKVPSSMILHYVHVNSVPRSRS